MNIKLTLAPNQTILQDREVLISLIGGNGFTDGKATEQLYFLKTRDVIKDGELVDYETKEGNMTVPRLPAEIIENPNDFLEQINALLSSLPDSAGLVCVAAEIV